MDKKCNLCDKTTDKIHDLHGIKMCKDCFETIVRLSQFKSIKFIDEEEGKTLMTFLKNLIDNLNKK